MGRYESDAVRKLVERSERDVLQHPLSPYAPTGCERCGGMYEHAAFDLGPWDVCDCTDQKGRRMIDYGDGLYDEPEAAPPEPDEPCDRGCGYFGHSRELLNHQHYEHRRCAECGAAPHDPLYAVTHERGCPRLQPGYVYPAPRQDG